MLFAPGQYFGIDVDTHCSILDTVADPFTAHFCGTAKIFPQAMRVISTNIAEGLVNKIIFMGNLLHGQFIERMPVGFCAQGARFVGMFFMVLFMFIFGKFHQRDYATAGFAAEQLSPGLLLINQYY